MEIASPKDTQCFLPSSPSILQKPNVGVRTPSSLKQYCYGWIVLGLAVILLCPTSSRAQSWDLDGSFFAKLGTGLSDYTGDFPAQNTGYPVDFQEFIRGSGLPIVVNGEVGYEFSRHGAVILGIQGGNYPIVGYGGGRGISDSYRYTPQLLGRYTFDRPFQDGLLRSLAPYVDGGLNVTFGGAQNVGVGPSLGAGVNIPVDRSLSFYVESRFNLTFPDNAIDGASSAGGPFDSVNQLLGFGVKYTFGGSSRNVVPDPPPAITQSSQDSVKTSPDSMGMASKTPSPSETSRSDTSEKEEHEESVLIPSGSFIMGLTDEDPLSLQNAGRKRITVSSFYIEQYEVTNAEYRDYLSELSPEKRRKRLPDSTAWSKARTQESWDAYFRSDYYADYPVVAVTWTEAQAYCQAQNMRLPTEAEWEYAARGGHVGRVYPWNGLSTQNAEGEYLANYSPPGGYSADGYAFTAPVDAIPQNGWNLYNVAGNVAEWTRDAYTSSYDNLSDFNPYHQDEDEPRHVIRGGAWNSNATFISVGMRDTQPQDEASIDVGFRCVQEVTDPKNKKVATGAGEIGRTGQE